jgi:uncharacterized membrane protein
MIDFLIPYYKQYPFLASIFDLWRDTLLGFQILIVIIFLISSKNYKRFLIYFLAFLFGFLIAIFIKLFLPSLRPISIHFPESLFFDSFPSSHTLISTVFSFLLIFDNFKLGLLSFPLTILIAFFSYFSLMHRLVDIFFGFFLGLLIGYIFSRGLIFINLKRKAK